MACRVLNKEIRPYLEPPQAIHIATEGPLGLFLRAYLSRHKIPFTTSYHTNWPEYLQKYTWLPQRLAYTYLRMFHRPSKTVMVSCTSLWRKLQAWRFQNRIRMWGRGVDGKVFCPKPHPDFVKSPRKKPVALYVGRVSSEKNLEAFLRCGNDVDKWVVGNGPQIEHFSRTCPAVKFWGSLHGNLLAERFADADVFVFPSRTDTFGLVLLEALACGLPVAAFPADNTIDIVGNDHRAGFLNQNLEVAIDEALAHGDPAACLEVARRYTWDKCTEQFVGNLCPWKG
jgi:glycosyltransferase involved in cell wall biosynthesis